MISNLSVKFIKLVFLFNTLDMIICMVSLMSSKSYFRKVCCLYMYFVIFTYLFSMTSCNDNG